MFRLRSPFGGSPIKFSDSKSPSSIFEELMEVLSLLVQIAGDLSAPIDHIISQFDGSKESLIRLFSLFNRQGSTFKQLCPLYSMPHMPNVRMILELAYHWAVDNPRKLRKYKPFSPEVYGETLPPMVEVILESIGGNSGGFFLDLGSGVGQVILQVAASRKFHRCVGIEKSKVPSDYAKTLESNFTTLMSFCGQSYSPVELYKGDFLEHRFEDVIQRATVIFVNNYSFGPELDNKLRDIFSQLKDGTQVISSRPFCGARNRLSERSQSDISSMMHVRELPTVTGGVSWTNDPFCFYLHTVDSTMIEEYYNRLKSETKQSLRQNTDKLGDFIDVINSWDFVESCKSEIGKMIAINSELAGRMEKMKTEVKSLEQQVVTDYSARFLSMFGMPLTTDNLVECYNVTVDEYLNLNKQIGGIKRQIENSKKAAESAKSRKNRSSVDSARRKSIKTTKQRGRKYMDGAADSSGSSLEDGEISDDEEESYKEIQVFNNPSLDSLNQPSLVRLRQKLLNQIKECDSVIRSGSSQFSCSSSDSRLISPVGNVASHCGTDLRSLVYGVDSSKAASDMSTSDYKDSHEVDLPTKSTEPEKSKFSFKICKPVKRTFIQSPLEHSKDNQNKPVVKKLNPRVPSITTQPIFFEEIPLSPNLTSTPNYSIPYYDPYAYNMQGHPSYPMIPPNYMYYYPPLGCFPHGTFNERPPQPKCHRGRWNKRRKRNQ